MGHSLLIHLLANPAARITAIDISGQYASPAVDVLRKRFPRSSINLIIADSLTGLAQVSSRPELFHIDGGHYEDLIASEYSYITGNLCNKVREIIFDDVIVCGSLVSRILLGHHWRVMEYELSDCPSANAYFSLHSVQ
jgi:hypothetical protein